MVKTQSQLDIANKSYTNKDFAEIYKELLTYAEKLSYRFSPVSANEADPFIVLLKLLAFVADKINYNIDKNILERFMLSCTQETSMRELASIVGYYMHYYRSAYTSVIFTHSDATSNLIIPKYSILSTDNNLQYVTIEQAQINSGSIRSSLPVLAMQGKLKTLSVLGSELIQLENLDANNRIYFSEYQVAENGVFIEQLASNGIESNEWVRVDNLNEEEYLSYSYYFGYDSTRQLPYLEFPTWISRIIGNGLIIRYIVTDGYAGNIGAKALTKVIRASKPEGDEIDDSTITVVNSSAASNGADPETIEESYSGFKKLVGTLDTLITCRDYAARICELLDSNGYPLVSNAIVADRRTDINYSSQLYTANDLGKHYVISPCVDYDEKNQHTRLSANELCVYPYKPMLSKGYLNAFNTKNGYEASYEAYTDIEGTNDPQMPHILEALESSKAMTHDYRQLQGDDILAIQIKVAVQAIISTYTKISEVEANEIKLNVLDALINKYNLHNLTPGFEIPFDDIYETILYSDARIKSVSLSEPLQTPEIYMYNENKDKNKALAFLVVKNIISGRISAFSFDERFNYEYFYKNPKIYNSVASVTTKAQIQLKRNSNDEYRYVLQDNEVVQFIAPKLNTSISYPYGVVYSLTLNGSKDCIRKNAEYRLAENEHLMLAYADSDNTWSFDYYEGSNDSSKAPIILNPNFDMYTCAFRKAKANTPTKKFDPTQSNTRFEPFDNMVGEGREYWFYALQAKDELCVKNPVEEALINGTYAYWITRNPDNKINWTQVGDLAEYILREDEYFYYCDAGLTYLVEFSSGTKLVIPYHAMNDSSIHKNRWIIASPVSADSIANNGISGLAGNVEYLSCSNANPLSIYVNEIKTLSMGDNLIITPTANADTVLNIPYNLFKNLDTDIWQVKYIYDNNEAKTEAEASTELLPDRSTLPPQYNWRWRSVLDINVSPSTEQILINSNTNSYSNAHAITFYDKEGNELDEITSSTEDLIPRAFRSSIPLNINGGQNVPVTFVNIDSLSITEECPSFMTYYKDPLTESCTHKLDMEDFYNMRIDLTSSLLSEPKYEEVLSVEGTPIDFHIPMLTNSIGALTVIMPNSYVADEANKIQLSMLPKIIDAKENEGKVSIYNITNNTCCEIDKKGSASGQFKFDPGVNNIMILSNCSACFNLNVKVKIENVSTGTAIDPLVFKMSKFKIITDINPSLGIKDLLKTLYTAYKDMKVIPNVLDITTKSMTFPTDETEGQAYVKALVGIVSMFNISKLSINTAKPLAGRYIPDALKALLFEPIEASKEIQVTSAYPLISAQGFYDPNNLANGWVLPKISFMPQTSSDIDEYLYTQIDIAKNSIKR